MAGEAWKGPFAYPFSGPTACGAVRNAAPADLTVKPLRGGGSVNVYITPVPAQGTSTYPPDAAIVGQEPHAKAGGFRALFNVQISDWDAAHILAVDLRAYEVQADSAGFLSANADPANVGGNLVVADIPCQKICAGGLNNGGFARRTQTVQKHVKAARTMGTRAARTPSVQGEEPAWVRAPIHVQRSPAQQAQGAAT